MDNQRRLKKFLLSIILFGLSFCGTGAQSTGSPQRIGCQQVNMTVTCFDFYNASLAWSDAWSNCLTSNSQLALLSDPHTEAMIGNYMLQITGNMDGDYPVWIAGRELSDLTWRWVTQRPFQAQNMSQLTTLISAQLNRYENCAVVSLNSSTTNNATNSSTSGSAPNLIIQSSQCKNTLTKGYICQQNVTNTTASATCQIGSTSGVIIVDQCYAVFSPANPVSWFNARLSCHSLGADLASFNESSSSDLTAIMSLLPNTTINGTYWIGLRSQPWSWVTGFNPAAQNVTAWNELWYTDWQADSPYLRGRSCMGINGQLGVSYGWVNQICGSLYPYICQTTTILTTTPPPTTTPNMTIFDNSTWGINGTDFNGTTSTTTTVATGSSSLKDNIVSIIIPCVIVAIVIIVIGFTIYCYFAQRRDGYIQHQ